MFDQPWPPGDSAMAARVRDHDWAATPAGPLATWSPEMRTAASFVLDTGMPAALVWRTGLVTLYNDAFRPILGAKADALGRSFADVWAEAWHEIGPIAERALAGESTFIADFALVVDRSGTPEQAYFTFAYTPVRAADGSVTGFIDTVVETTAGVVARRREQESEARFRAFVVASSDVVYRMSADWREILDISGRPLFADPPGSGDWIDHYFEPDDRPQVRAAVARSVATGEPFEQEHRVRRRDGTLGWTLSRAVPIRGEDGAIVEWLGAASDVTERHAAAARVAENEQRLRIIVENALDYAIFRTDPDGVVVDWQPGAAAVFGWSAEEIVGRPCDILYTPEDRAAAQPSREFATARERGVAPDVRWHVAKDGRRMFIEGSVTALRDPDGTLTGFLKVGQDVTERRAAHMLLEESEERFRQFAEASSDILWIAAAATLHLEYIGPGFARLFGPEPLTLPRLLRLVVRSDRRAVIAALRAVRCGEAGSHEFRVRRPGEGDDRWFRTTDFPFTDASGNVHRVGGIVADVTEMKRAGVRLEVLVQELQHRSRNLLGVVTSIAHRTLGRDGAVAGFATRLRALSRAQGLLSQVGTDTVEVGSLIRLELSAHVEVAPPKVTLAGPEVQLRQRQVQNFALALHELTTNAVKYGALKLGSPGRLSVTWHETHDERGPRLALEWRESGVPVSPDAGDRRGYGRTMIEESLSYSLRARTEYDIGPDGVRCRIDLPLS